VRADALKTARPMEPGQSTVDQKIAAQLGNARRTAHAHVPSGEGAHKRTRPGELQEDSAASLTCDLSEDSADGPLPGAPTDGALPVAVAFVFRLQLCLLPDPSAVSS
jgi:hypothetical protein